MHATYFVIIKIRWFLAKVPAGAGAGGGGARPGGGDKEAEAHHQAQWPHQGSEESDGNAKKIFKCKK